MQVNKVAKKIDYTKLNIGTELEALLVNQTTLQTVSIQESQSIFSTLIKKYGWTQVELDFSGRIYVVSKTIADVLTEIQLDTSFALFEISTPSPFSELDTMRAVHHGAVSDLRSAAQENGAMIWPFGVAPASMNLFNLPFSTREDRVDDPVYQPMSRLEYQPRFCHIASHQVSIDVPVNKIIPAMNALYKNLGTIIDTFACSPVKHGDMLYKEGRYYWWNDLDHGDKNIPALDSEHYQHGAKPIFPDHQFRDLQDFYSWTWQGHFLAVMRDGRAHTFKDLTMSPARYIQEGKGTVLTIDGQEKEVALTKEDVEVMFIMNYLDFKLHFELDEFTLQDFLEFYTEKNLDGFFEKYCRHSYLEIRPCSPHWEDDAMVIPKYFYDIFQHLDEYIEKSQSIDWEVARAARNRAIGYPTNHQ